MALLFLKALAVGALVHGGVGLMGADLDGGQTAVLLGLTVVDAAGDRALDGAVGGAGGAAVGAISHNWFLLVCWVKWGLPRIVCSESMRNMRKKTGKILGNITK